MKLVVFILVAGSLVLGLMAAASAYLAPLHLADEALVGLTAADTIQHGKPVPGPAGPSVPAAGTAEPLVRKGATLDASALRRLRENGVARLRVEEFAFERWTGRWLFVGACAGLVAGGLLGRWSAKQQAQRAGATGDGGPELHLDRADAALRELLARWSGFAGRDVAARETVAALSPVIDEVLPAFAAARPVIVSRRGLGGYAAVMDRFAAAERQVHRAWSAAADGVPEESRECVQRARALLEATRAILRQDQRG